MIASLVKSLLGITPKDQPAIIKDEQVKSRTAGVSGLARRAFCTHPKSRRRFITGGVMDPGDVQCLDCGKWEAVEINEKDWSKSRRFWTRQHPYGPQGRQLDSSNPFIDENSYA